MGSSFRAQARTSRPLLDVWVVGPASPEPVRVAGVLLGVESVVPVLLSCAWPPLRPLPEESVLVLKPAAVQGFC
jgi:hypothetical protein